MSYREQAYIHWSFGIRKKKTALARYNRNLPDWPTDRLTGIKINTCSVARKFIGWVWIQCLNVCMTWNYIVKYFWKWMETYYLQHWMCRFTLTSFNKWMDLTKPTRSESPCEWNASQIAGSQENLRIGKLQFRSSNEKHFPTLRTQGLTVCHDIYIYMGIYYLLQQEYDIYFTTHASVDNSRFLVPFEDNDETAQSNFKRRWEICAVILTWEVHFNMLDSLTLYPPIDDKFPDISEKEWQIKTFSEALILWKVFTLNQD
jgi:hypothetical protein